MYTGLLMLPLSQLVVSYNKSLFWVFVAYISLHFGKLTIKTRANMLLAVHVCIVAMNVQTAVTGLL